MKAEALYNREISAKLGIPIEVSVDAKSVYAAAAANEARIPAEASLIALLLSLREQLREGRLERLFWINTHDMLADGLTKGGVSREAILHAMMTGR